MILNVGDYVRIMFHPQVIICKVLSWDYDKDITLQNIKTKQVYNQTFEMRDLEKVSIETHPEYFL